MAIGVKASSSSLSAITSLRPLPAKGVTGVVVGRRGGSVHRGLGSSASGVLGDDSSSFFGLGLFRVGTLTSARCVLLLSGTIPPASSSSSFSISSSLFCRVPFSPNVWGSMSFRISRSPLMSNTLDMSIASKADLIRDTVLFGSGYTAWTCALKTFFMIGNKVWVANVVTTATLGSSLDMFRGLRRDFAMTWNPNYGTC